MNIHVKRLMEPETEVLAALNRWDNDPAIVHFIRPSKNKDELECRREMTWEGLEERLGVQPVFLIYLDGTLVGEMNYMIDPGHLFNKTPGTAWIGITIGEREARGKGVGYQAMKYLEKEIHKQGLKRIELGVFAFNEHAQHLYKQLGYKEIGRVPDFTFWNGKMWDDIRMEKYVVVDL
nr:GNAT family protein [Bacillus sp. KH172YL63]